MLTMYTLHVCCFFPQKDTFKLGMERWVEDSPWMLDLPPNRCNNYHQDYDMFSRESQPKPLFATGILGGRWIQHTWSIWACLPTSKNSWTLSFRNLPMSWKKEMFNAFYTINNIPKKFVFKFYICLCLCLKTNQRDSDMKTFIYSRSPWTQAETL